MYYKLDKDKNVVPSTLEEWAGIGGIAGIVDIEREVYEGFLISTIFLGMSASFIDTPALLFETMIFDESGKNRLPDEYQERCGTYEQAIEQHKTAKEHLRSLEI